MGEICIIFSNDPRTAPGSKLAATMDSGSWKGNLKRGKSMQEVIT